MISFKQHLKEMHTQGQLKQAYASHRATAKKVEDEGIDADIDARFNDFGVAGSGVASKKRKDAMKLLRRAVLHRRAGTAAARLMKK